MNASENEYHFVLVCPVYRSIRTTYLPGYYYCSWPNHHKLHKLLQASSKFLTIKLCRYLNAAWNLRLYTCIVP